MKNALLYLSIMFVLAGCQFFQSGESGDKTLQSGFKIANDKGSTLYIADAELARDFMPMISSSREPIGGRPLMGTLIIRRIDKSNIPEDMKVVKVVVKSGDHIWTAENTTAEIYKPEPDYLTVRFSNGPKWEPSSVADINFEYVDSDGKKYTIAIFSIKIETVS